MDIDNNKNSASVASNDEVKSTIMTSIISSVFTVLIILTILVISFQPIRTINQNKMNIETSQVQVAEIKESIDISRAELEAQVKDYIAKNYGELSERDEKVDKLLIYFRQQDARLSNIEQALSKF